MKIAAFLLITVVGVVYSEYCDSADTSGTSCGHVICETPSVPTCQHDMCTCGPKPSDSSCGTPSDCTRYFSGHHCSHDRRHCIDGTCKCQKLGGDGDD